MAIFASGKGSNAQRIVEYFKRRKTGEVAMIVSNKPRAGVLRMAEENGIRSVVIDRSMFYESQRLLEVLRDQRIDFIVLAGFLWLMPEYLVRAFPDKIVNIHPALLPKYGGKGMYGMHVHEAVHKAGDDKSGMTIHFVNERYDKGSIIFQAQCELDASDGPNTIAAKVLNLEHQYYPEVIEKLLNEL